MKPLYHADPASQGGRKQRPTALVEDPPLPGRKNLLPPPPGATPVAHLPRLAPWATFFRHDGLEKCPPLSCRTPLRDNGMADAFRSTPRLLRASRGAARRYRV